MSRGKAAAYKYDRIMAYRERIFSHPRYFLMEFFAPELERRREHREGKIAEEEMYQDAWDEAVRGWCELHAEIDAGNATLDAP